MRIDIKFSLLDKASKELHNLNATLESKRDCDLFMNILNKCTSDKVHVINFEAKGFITAEDFDQFA